MKKRRIIFLCLAAALIFSLLHLPEKGHVIAVETAVAQEDWENEFQDICAKTQDAMTFSPETLKHLVERCDHLKPLVEQLKGPKKKIFLKKLKKCRDLFQFVLESKGVQ